MSDPVTKRRPMIDLEDSTLVSHHGGVADEEIWSWRPRFIIVVIVATFVAAMAEIALSLATIKAENGRAKLQKEATTRVDIPARDASILSKPPGPPPMALVNTTKQPLDLPQAEEKTQPFGSLAGPKPPPTMGLRPWRRPCRRKRWRNRSARRLQLSRRK